MDELDLFEIIKISRNFTIIGAWYVNCQSMSALVSEQVIRDLGTGSEIGTGPEN